MTSVLLLTAALHGGLLSDDFVFRACMVTEDEDVQLREEKDKTKADMCIWVTGCESADLKVKFNPQAKRAFFRTFSSKRCM